MKIRAAIEVMKLLAPYHGELVKATRGAEMVVILLKQFEESQPVDLMRFISLVYGYEMNALAEILKDADGADVYNMVLVAFTFNPLVDMLNTMEILGFVRDSNAG